MGIDQLERRAGTNTHIVDDATILEHLAYEQPGPLSLMLLESMDPTTLDSDGRLKYAKAWDRQQRWATARAQNALVHVLIEDLPGDDNLIALEMSQRCDMAAVTTFGGWTLKCHGNGSLTWVSPGGTQFFVAAEDHGPTR